MKQLSLFEEQIPEEKLPTSLTSDRHPIHRWFNFVAGFSPEFVSQCIRSAKLKTIVKFLDSRQQSLINPSVDALSAQITQKLTIFLVNLCVRMLCPTPRLSR